VVDPMSEKFANETPYNYAGDNPVNLIDEDGKYKIKPSDQKKYSVLTNYLKNGVKEILNSPKIMAALKKYGQFSEKDIRDKIVKWNSGIEIQIVDKPGSMEGANGYYMGGKDHPIQISSALAAQLQNASPEDQQAALLAAFSTILHESVHYGDWTADGSPASDNAEIYYNSDGTVSGYSGEVGDAFESDVYLNGDYWEQQETKKKVGKEGLNNMRKRIDKKSKTEGGKKDLPRMSWQQIGGWLNNALQANPNIQVTSQ